MTVASFDVCLTLQGPILTQATSSSTFGLDAAMARSGDHYYLPGTLIKGLVGEAWQELASVASSYVGIRERWLGRESDQGDNEPARGNLFFNDLLDRETPTQGVPVRTRIEIDKERGSAMSGQHLVLETPYQSGGTARFEGRIWVLANSEREARDVHQHVQTAFNWITSVGAARSVGFGRVLAANCAPLSVKGWAPRDRALTPAEALDLTLHFDHPVCFARQRVADNLFESERWIVGGALKGALAALLAAEGKRWWALRQHLHQVRFTHAFPTSEVLPRPIYPPVSLVKVSEDRCLDAILVPEAQLVDGSPPAFQVDWKSASDVWQCFGWTEPQQELRIRTAIDGDRRKAADDKLFAYQMLVPRGIVWRARVLFAGVDSAVRSTIAAELQDAVQHGVFALGKTKAHARVEVTPAAAPVAALDIGHVAITLQTAALLCDPGRYLAPNGSTGTSDRELMWREYEAVWRDLSEGALQLEHYFHHQSLAGGEYFRRRFQRGQPYRPYLLTDAGSVFFLRIENPERAHECVTKWLQQGIELSPAVRAFYRLDAVAPARVWQHCPFLPENGYGEVAVDVHKLACGDVEVWNV